MEFRPGFGNDIILIFLSTTFAHRINYRWEGLGMGGKRRYIIDVYYGGNINLLNGEEGGFMIGWSYLDKKKAAVADLKDYTAMKKILANTPQAIKEGVGAGNPAGSFDKIDVLQQRYKHAREFMDWFEPAWCYLDDTEQLVLKEFYM